MREIKFRGLDKHGFWIYGDLTGDSTIHSQPPHVSHDDGTFEWWGYEVIEGTVGQYTGIKDLKGTEIYEGDVVQYETCNGSFKKDVVIFCDSGFYMGDYPVNNICEIIGNIHLTPPTP